MPKYHVTVVSQIRRTRVYELEASNKEEAEDLVDDDVGKVISDHEKYFDGDSWVEEIKDV